MDVFSHARDKVFWKKNRGGLLNSKSPFIKRAPAGREGYHRPSRRCRRARNAAGGLPRRGPRSPRRSPKAAQPSGGPAPLPGRGPPRSPRSLSLMPRWLSSSVQTLETSDKYSSFASSSAATRSAMIPPSDTARPHPSPLPHPGRDGSGELAAGGSRRHRSAGGPEALGPLCDTSSVIRGGRGRRRGCHRSALLAGGGSRPPSAGRAGCSSGGFPART